jgi:hypothetical protein
MAALGSSLIALSLGAGSADAVDDPPDGITCTYDETSRTFTVTVGMGVDHGGRVQRVGDELAVIFELEEFRKNRKGKVKPHLIVTRENCSGTTTVNNTDRIRILMLAEEETDFEISLAGGALAPGATPEADGTSEIEISVEHLEPGLTVGFIGRPDADFFRFGSKSGVPGVNLNAQAESNSPDVDATLASDPQPDPRLFNPDWPALSAQTGDGDDAVTSGGGPEFDAPFSGAFSANGGAGNDSLIATTSRFTFIKGAGGNDFIEGVGNRNVMFGGGGADTIITGEHGDDVEPGKGRDLAVLKGGFDIVAAHDRTRDRILCGKNRDAISKDRKDRTPGCERRSFRPFHLKIFTD